MDDYVGCLAELTSFSDDPSRVEIIVKRMERFFTEETSEFSVELLLFLTFGKNGITSFVMEVLNSERSKNCLLSAIDLLQFLLVNFESYCVPYVEKVKKLCLAVARYNVPSKVKENAFTLLKSIFVPVFIPALDLSRIMTDIRGFLTDGKVAPTVQTQVLSLVGLIFEGAPEASVGDKDWFYSFISDEINSISFKKNSKSKPSTMAGCFDCINGYLVNFSLPGDEISKIYRYLKECSSLNAEQTRFASARSALTVIKRHYRVFANHISKDLDSWVGTLNLWLKKTGKDRQLGFQGLVSVYRAVACACEESKSFGRSVDSVVEKLLKGRSLPSTIGLVELISAAEVREDLVDRALQLIIRPINTAKGDDLMSLSVNVECLSKYLSKSKPVNPVYLNHLRVLAVTLIDEYPKMDSHFRRYALEALENSFYHMEKCDRRELDEYSKDVVYQGLIRSCSHTSWTEAELQKEITGKEVISHKSYLPLWLHMLNLSSNTVEVNVEIVVRKIFDEYVSSFLRMNRKLDLRIEMKNPRVADSGVEAEAVRPKDFQIFNNNVSLFEDLVGGTRNYYFVKSLRKIFAETTGMSNRSPLVSGFYRVVAVCLRIADEFDFFDDPANGEFFASQQRYLKEVSVKAGQYKGELQICCFQVLLAAPVSLIEPLVKDLVPIFKVILRVGFGYFPLLKESIYALERWHDKLPKESMDGFLREILPHFDLFLQSKNERNCAAGEGFGKAKSSKEGRQIRTVNANKSESQLAALQKRFLLFLGKLDQEVSRNLIRPKEDAEGEAEIGTELTYDMPLLDKKLRIHLEKLLPRVMDISLSSGDRGTRVTACELLHSLVLLTLARMRQVNGELNALFRKLVSLCLVLGCDSDHVVVQIFEPLAVQMAHYFSQGERPFPEVEVFIRCIMEAVSHEYNTSLRDFGAKLVRELTEWSIRELRSGVPTTVNAIIRSMCSFSVHPDHNKRCGAAIVFNNIYSLIRDEELVLHTHWFLLYYYFMESLDMCTSYDDTTHIISAIGRIKEPLADKNLKVVSEEVPPGFSSNSLTSLLKWTFARCSHLETKIRALSMNLIEDLCRNVYATEPVKRFVEESVDEILVKAKWLSIDPDEEEYLLWLRHHEMLFDYYGWLLRHGVFEISYLKQVRLVFMAESFLEQFMSSQETHDSDWVAVTKMAAIIQALEFLHLCLELGLESCGTAAREVIKICLYRPSKFKFDVCDLESRQRLTSVVKKLVEAHGEDHFVDIAAYSSVFGSLRERLRSRESLAEMADFLNGLKTMRSLGLWESLRPRPVCGDQVVTLIFDSLFVGDGRRSHCVAVDPNDKSFLVDFLKFGMDTGMSLDGITNLAKNGSLVIDAETSERYVKGEYFIGFFRDEVLAYLIKQSDSSIDFLVKNLSARSLRIIFEMLTFADRSCAADSERRALASNLCRRWSQLDRVADEGSEKAMGMIILGRICKIDPEVLVKERTIRGWVLREMSREGLAKGEEAVFDLLQFLSPTDEEVADELAFALENVLANVKRLDSACPKVGLLYAGLMNNLRRSKSLLTLRMVTRLLADHQQLLDDGDIEAVLGDGEPAPEEHLKGLLSYLFGELFTDNSVVCERFLHGFLLKCESKLVLSFLFSIFDRVLDTLRNGDIRFRISTLSVVQLCASMIRREDLEEMPSEKKESFKTLIAACLNPTPSEGDEESFRKYACSRFNTLCAVISAKTDNPELFRQLIFKEDFPFLALMVNREKTWVLRMDFDKLPKRRKVLTAIRKRITRKKQAALGETVASVRYLQGETLFESSLKEDVTRFDFSNSLVRPMDPQPQGLSGDCHVELEMDDLNGHEAMATLVGLVERMVEEGITPVSDGSPPFWLSAMLHPLNSFSRSVNEKIFILKLLFNIEKYIKPYGSEIVPDLLNALLVVFQEKPINYLVIDIVTVILNWDLDLSRVNAREKFSMLALYVVDKSDSYRKDIIQSNLEIAKLIIEACRDSMNVRELSAKAFEKLKTDLGQSEIVSYLNLHFCGILLANSIPCWTDNNEKEFLQLLLRYFGGKNGKLAAEVTGLALKHFVSNRYRGAVELVETVKETIRRSVVANGAGDLSLLHSIHRNHPEISAGFARTLRTSAYTTSGPFKVQSLEMLLTEVKRGDHSELFDSIMSTFLGDILSPGDFEALSLALQILRVALGRMDQERMSEVVGKALPFGDCKSASIRREVYHVAETAIREWKEEDEVLRRCKVVLLKGMNDSDRELSERCLQFWYGRTADPTSLDRFHRVLTELCEPETETEFLNFVARLMIRSASSTDEYGQLIFEHPVTTKGTFQKRIILKTAPGTVTASMLAQSQTLQSLKMSSGGKTLPQTWLTHQDEDVVTPVEGGTDSKKKGRRFLRDVEKARASFARRQIARREAALEEEKERARRPDDHLDILNEYTDGEYPNVQMTHSHVLKPLEALARKDPQVGRLFLASLYDGFALSLADREADSWHAKMRRLIRGVFQGSSDPDPAVVGFLFHVLLRCRGRLDVDSECVAKIAKSSGWLSVGGLIIEEMITAAEGSETFSPRKEDTPEEKKWLSLAEVSRCLREFEILRGIFLDKLRVVDCVGEAVRAESTSDWSKAAACYELVLQRPSFKSSRSDFYVDAYLTSLARLSDWRKLNTRVRDSHDPEELWSDSPLFEKVLPWFVKSEMMKSLRSGDGSFDALVMEIEDDPDKEPDLKKFFLEELAIAHFSSRRHQWLSHYLNQMSLNFLTTWSHWNKWSNNLRADRLLQLQLMSELDLFRGFFQKRKPEVEDVDELVRAWSRNVPRESDDLLRWDVRLACRDHFVLSSDLAQPPVQRSMARSELLMVRAGIAQRNVRLASEYLNVVGGRLDLCEDEDLRLMHRFYRSSLEVLEVEMDSTGWNSRVRKLVDVAGRLLTEMSGSNQLVAFDRGRGFFEYNMALSRIMRQLASGINHAAADSVAYAAKHLNLRRGDEKREIEAKELQYLQGAEETVRGTDEELLSKAYMEMAKFYRRGNEYNKQLPLFLFRAMSLGSSEARRLFCCLLNERQLARDWVLDSDLKVSCGEVPAWMFLRWTNQLLANLDSEMFPFARDLLRPLADEYPESIRFAFALSRENYKFAHGEYGPQCREFVHHLERILLSDTTQQDFLTALSYVVSPELLVRYDLDKILAEVRRETPDWESVVGAVRRLHGHVFGSRLKPFRGKVFDSLAEIEPEVEELLDLKHEALEWAERIRSIGRKLKSNDKDNLKAYSPWLHSFRWTGQRTRVEVPGQYDGEQRPIPKRHATISSFKYGVLVMKSKCKPIRISMLGDNAKVYRFLVKFGEDLRQDQRIQHVFGDVNHALAGDHRTRRLSLDTYKVIPVKSNLGLIEWVDDTRSLHELLAEDPSVRETMERVQQQQLEFLAQGESLEAIQAHLNGYLKVGRDRAVARFAEAAYAFEWDLLRKAFWRMSSSPEQFVCLRNNFAVSQAVIYVAHWLVGIGDRHLDNTLVSSRSGRALGIDFGCAFGFATEFLTPPELVPFRLTPQIVNLMKPLGESGLMKETMTRCLRTLRSDHSVLVAALEVFALEPALDWLEKARRNPKSRTGDGGWSPRRKIAAVREKLEGANPVSIFREDLQSGHSNSPCLKSYLEVVTGSGMRSQLPDWLTAEQQVECLIDLATDGHVLSKTYVGWNPWL